MLSSSVGRGGARCLPLVEKGSGSCEAVQPCSRCREWKEFYMWLSVRLMEQKQGAQDVRLDYAG